MQVLACGSNDVAALEIVCQFLKSLNIDTLWPSNSTASYILMKMKIWLYKTICMYAQGNITSNSPPKIIQVSINLWMEK
jgi:hypothetical protein